MPLDGLDPVELDRWIERDPERDLEGCPDCGGPLKDEGGCDRCAAYDDHVDQLIDEAKERER